MASPLEFRLLGSFELARGPAPVALTSNKLRVVLAALLVADGKTVPFETLIERLWDSQPPEAARSTLQVHVMRLRRTLGDDGLIETSPGGYRIAIEPSRVDVASFHELLTRARRTDQVDVEATLLAEALALWRGPALLGVDSESLHQAVVPQLTEERLQAVERYAEIELGLGRQEGLIGELTTLAREHPLRERLWTHLIDALHRSGRRVEALEAYRGLRLTFRDELGIEPSGDVQRLHQDILAEDTGQSRREPGRGWREPAVRPRQLPPNLSGFVGRPEELARLRGQLAAGGDTATPLVVVSGPPGVGKTAFAVHVAHQIRAEYPDGQLYVDLHGHGEGDPLAPTLVLERFLRVLGVPAGEVPVEPQEQIDLYRSLLAQRRMLVVLDNAATPGQVRPLLPASSGCAAVVTSREDLRGLAVFDGATRLALTPLTDQEAQEILIDLVGKARAAAEPDAIARLAVACGRLPLALRIAGANLAANSHLTLADYVAELRAHGALARLAVHDDQELAVRAAFDLSYLRLPAPAARLFRLLGVVPGADFTPHVAAALTMTDLAEATGTLDRLSAANLIFPSACGRYQIHDLLREYAHVRAGEDSTETEAAATRLFDFYQHTARNATTLLYPDSTRGSLPPPAPGAQPSRPDTEQAALAWLEAELPNLVATALRAHDHGKPTYARQLAETLRGHFWAEGYRVEGLAMWDAALDAAQEDGDPRAAVAVLDLSGLTHYMLGRYRQAIDHHRRALRLNQETGDQDVSLTSLHHLARAHVQAGDQDEAIHLHEQALDLAATSGNHTARLLHLNHLGFAAFVSGRPDLAAGHHQEALDLARDIGDLPTQAQAHNGVGLAAWGTGHLDKSITAHEQACMIATQIGDDHLRGFSSNWLAASRCAAGQYDQAITDAELGIHLGRAVGEPRQVVIGTLVHTLARHRRGDTGGLAQTYLEALHKARQLGFVHGEIPLLIHLAEAQRTAGDPHDALAHATAALDRTHEAGTHIMRPLALIEIANCHLARGDHQPAVEALDEALLLARAGGQRLNQAKARHAYGHLAAEGGDHGAATKHWRSAQRLFTSCGAPEAAELRDLLTAR